MHWRDWFQWHFGGNHSSLVIMVTLSLLALFWVLAALANRLRRTPGPLTKEERELLAASPARRRLVLLLPLAAVAVLVLALTSQVVSVRRPTIAVLWSRTAIGPPPARFFSVVSPGRGPLAPRVLDLGRVVDAVLTDPVAVRMVTAHVLTDPSDRRAIDAVVTAAYLSHPPRTPRSIADLQPPQYPPTDTGPEPSREIVESIELSVLRLAMVRSNARQARVWPGLSEPSLDSWYTAQLIFRKMGCRLEIGASASISQGSLPQIVQFADVAIFRDGQIRGYALVVGRFSAPTAVVQLPAWIQRTDASSRVLSTMPVGVEVRGDESEQRIVPFSLKVDPLDSGVADALRGPGTSNQQLFLRCRSAGTVAEAGQLMRRPEFDHLAIEVRGAGAPELMRAIVRAAQPHDSTAKAFGYQLEAMGAVRPVLAQGGEDRVCVRLTGRGAVVARSWGIVDQAAGFLEVPRSDGVIQTRHQGPFLDPATIFSMHRLQFPMQVTGLRSSAPTGAPLLDAAPARPQAIAASETAAWALELGGERAVVLGLAEPAILLDHQSAASAAETPWAVLQFVSWAANWVAYRDFGEGGLRLRPDTGELAGPMILEASEERLRARGSLPAGLLAIASGLGLILWFLSTRSHRHRVRLTRP